MKSSQFIGTYNHIVLLEIVKQLEPLSGTSITTNFDYWDMSNNAYKDIYEKWQRANFNPNSIKWINYYPKKDFDEHVIIDIGAHISLNGIHRSWISRLDPGYYAPWHWDVDDNEDKYLEFGQIKRYSIIIHPPTLGHILIIGDDYIFNAPAGTIVEWKNHREWHAGINAGLVTNFMLHIVGY